MTTLTRIASVGLLAGCLGLAFMTTPVHASNTIPSKLEQTLAKKDSKSTHSKKKQHKKKRGGMCRPGMPCYQANPGNTGGGCPGGNCPLPLDGDVGGY